MPAMFSSFSAVMRTITPFVNRGNTSAYWTVRLVFVAISLATTVGFAPLSRVPTTASSLERRQASPSRAFPCPLRFNRPFCLYARDNQDEDEDEDVDVSDQDWRAFRAKLVMGEPKADSSSEEVTASAILEEDDLDGIGAVFQSSTSSSSTTEQDEESSSSTLSPSTMTPLDPSQWAYDSGKVIEKGAVILGGVEQDYGFGLRQQYFHKAAILVLDHDENQFTKGIILNRPSDIMLEDDVNEGVKWRVWFGGDVQGLNSPNPDIVCLHSLKDEMVTRASIPVMKDIQWTTFESAKMLVKAGLASPDDFWVFCGYAGWGAGQLMGELDRKSWYMVATDSQTLLKELARQSSGADPRDAGLDTWDLLMNMIGRGETAEECSGDFDDLILKEWARENLLSFEAGGGGGMKQRPPEGIGSTQENLLKANPVDQLMKHVAAATRGEEVKEGSILRASPVDRSPFLLDNQEYHKSIVLVIMDDENISVGVILNRPAAKGLDMQITDKNTGASRSATVPIRYGGQYAVKGQDPILWLHCDPRLRAAQIGSEVGSDSGGIWKCTAEDVTSSIAQGLAKPEDFIAVSGVSVWPKVEAVAHGLQAEVRRGNFELIPAWRTESVWNALLQQDVLSNLNFVQNLQVASEAWLQGASDADGKNGGKENLAIGGLGEGFDEEDDTVVFKSDVKLSKLSDDALRSWVATFLLGAPSLGGF